MKMLVELELAYYLETLKNMKGTNRIVLIWVRYVLQVQQINRTMKWSLLIYSPSRVDPNYLQECMFGSFSMP